ncbi:MAG: hypothetical protein GKS05_13315 [Nitrospirales bacterium]|nr:hypothetical protein [Nitrospirales bacterium]NKB82833.1 hypothetical protein [Nitrospirales bacterium]
MEVLLSLILSCGYLADTETVTAVMDAATKRNPYYVRVANQPNPMIFQTNEEAITFVQQHRYDQHMLYIGPFSLPVSYLNTVNVSDEMLFDACLNIAWGTDKLEELFSECRTESQDQATTCAIKKYGTFIGRDPETFLNRTILSFAAQKRSNEANSSIDRPSSPESSPIFLNDSSHLPITIAPHLSTNSSN